MFREIGIHDLHALIGRKARMQRNLRQVLHYKQAPDVIHSANPMAVQHARINGIRAYSTHYEPIPVGHTSDLDVPPTKNQYGPCEPEEWLSHPPLESYPAAPQFSTPELYCGTTIPRYFAAHPDDFHEQYLPGVIPNAAQFAEKGAIDERCDATDVDESYVRSGVDDVSKFNPK